MFANQLVTYGGAGGIRRGLIWQNGTGKKETDFVSGHLLDIGARFYGNYPFSEVQWIKQKGQINDQWETFYASLTITGKHARVENGLLYMDAWQRFKDEDVGLSGIPGQYREMIRNAGFTPIYPQWGGSDPAETPYMNLWSQYPQEGTNLYYLPSINRIRENLTFIGVHQGVTAAYVEPVEGKQTFNYHARRYYDYRGYFYTDEGPFLQATEFSKEVYTLRNGKEWGSGVLGFCDIRIAKEADVLFYSGSKFMWVHVLDMPIPTALIALDE